MGPAAGAVIDPAGGRAGRQLLTGRAAQLPPSLSPSRLAWRKLKKNRAALAGGVVVIVLYAMALFAPFLAPYGYSSQDPRASFHSPMPVHLTPWPTVYGTRLVLNEYHERTFPEVRSRPHRLSFFVPGERYRLFGLIPVRRHLFDAAGSER